MVNLSPQFKTDIVGTNTPLKPIIVITDLTGNPIISIAEKITKIKYYPEQSDPEDNYIHTAIKTIPCLEKISSIKTSQDYDTKKLKINTLRVNVYNYYDVNTKLSEYVDDSLINKKIFLFYTSPSAPDVNISKFTINNTGALVYGGEISRIRFNKETISITAEDQTQKKISSKAVPYNTIENLPSYIRNKRTKAYEALSGVVPMTFGKVDKAPTLMYYEENSNVCMNVIHDTHPTASNYKTSKLLGTCNSFFIDEYRDKYYLYAKVGNQYIILDHKQRTVNQQQDPLSKSQIYSLSGLGTDLLLPELTGDAYDIGRRLWDMNGFIERRVVNYLISDGNPANIQDYSFTDTSTSNLLNLHKINDFAGKDMVWYREGDYVSQFGGMFDSGYRVLNDSNYAGTWIILTLDNAPSLKLTTAQMYGEYAGNTFLAADFIFSQHSDNNHSLTPNTVSQQWCIVPFNSEKWAEQGNAGIWWQTEEQDFETDTNVVPYLWNNNAGGKDIEANADIYQSPIYLDSNTPSVTSNLFWGNSHALNGEVTYKKICGNHLGYRGSYENNVLERNASEDNQILMWNQIRPTGGYNNQNDADEDFNLQTYARLKLNNVGFLQSVLVEKLNEQKIFASIVGRKCHMYTEWIDVEVYNDSQNTDGEEEIVPEDVVLPYEFLHTGPDQQAPTDFLTLIENMKQLLQRRKAPVGQMANTPTGDSEHKFFLAENDEIEGSYYEWCTSQNHQDEILEDFYNIAPLVEDNYFLSNYEFFLNFIFKPFHSKKTLLHEMNAQRTSIGSNYFGDGWAYNEYSFAGWGVEDAIIDNQEMSYRPLDDFINGYADAYLNEMFKFIYQQDTGVVSNWTSGIKLVDDYYWFFVSYEMASILAQYDLPAWNWYAAYNWMYYEAVQTSSSDMFNETLEVDLYRQYSWQDFQHSNTEEFFQNLIIYTEDLEKAFLKALHVQFINGYCKQIIDAYSSSDASSDWVYIYVVTELFPDISADSWGDPFDLAWSTSRPYAKGVNSLVWDVDEKITSITNAVEANAMVGYMSVLADIEEEAVEEEDSNFVTDGIISKPSDIVMNILTTEMEFGKYYSEDSVGIGIVSPNYEKYDKDSIDLSRAEHSQWNMGFSINSKRNGKKIIEEILAESKSYPTFSADGRFGLITIKEKYTWDDVDKVINHDDVLSFRFSETKREDIKTKVQFNYRYDYGNGNYAHNVVHDINTYLPDYGATAFTSNNISSVDTYEEKDLKYHSDLLTVNKFARFYLLNNCNTHNKVTLTLPINYIDCQVGDIIYLPLINNEKIFDTDYSKVDFKNSQPIYPAWIIMESVLSTDKIKIKAVQLHYLGIDGDHGFELPEEYNQPYEIYGCTEEFSSLTFTDGSLVPNYNYNPLATIDNNIRIPYGYVRYYQFMKTIGWQQVGDIQTGILEAGIIENGEDYTNPLDFSNPSINSIEQLVGLLTKFCNNNPEEFKVGGVLRKLMKYTSSGAARTWSDFDDFVNQDPEFYAEFIADFTEFVIHNGAGEYEDPTP